MRSSAKSIRWWLSRFGNVGLFFIAGVALIALLGVAQRTGWIQADTQSASTAAEGGSAEVYTCPMHPQIRQPHPGVVRSAAWRWFRRPRRRAISMNWP